MRKPPISKIIRLLADFQKEYAQLCSQRTTEYKRLLGDNSVAIKRKGVANMRRDVNFEKQLVAKILSLVSKVSEKDIRNSFDSACTHVSYTNSFYTIPIRAMHLMQNNAKDILSSYDKCISGFEALEAHIKKEVAQKRRIKATGLSRKGFVEENVRQKEEEIGQYIAEESVKLLKALKHDLEPYESSMREIVEAMQDPKYIEHVRTVAITNIVEELESSLGQQILKNLGHTYAEGARAFTPALLVAAVGSATGAHFFGDHVDGFAETTLMLWISASIPGYSWYYIQMYRDNRGKYHDPKTGKLKKRVLCKDIVDFFLADYLVDWVSYTWMLGLVSDSLGARGITGAPQGLASGLGAMVTYIVIGSPLLPVTAICTSKINRFFGKVSQSVSKNSRRFARAFKKTHAENQTSLGAAEFGYQ